MSDIHLNFAKPIVPGRISWPALRWPRLEKRSVPPLDIRSLPDHLKRDMGILDGNNPGGRRR